MRRKLRSPSRPETSSRSECNPELGTLHECRLVCSFLITDAQSPKLIEPGKAPLNDPTPSAQSAATFCVALGEPGHDVAGMQTLRIASAS